MILLILISIHYMRLIICMILLTADVVSLLRCSRYSLGIMASTRGTIIGRILLKVLNY